MAAPQAKYGPVPPWAGNLTWAKDPEKGDASVDAAACEDYYKYACKVLGEHGP